MRCRGTLYYAGTALDALHRAQADLDAHIGIGMGGRCPTCGEEVPCHTREAATRTFARYGWLPKRRAGRAWVNPMVGAGTLPSREGRVPTPFV
jgi:hypothetical protein